MQTPLVQYGDGQATASAAVLSFMQFVLRSGLLDEKKLQAALRTLPTDQLGDAEALAEHLVKTGQLTRFQARKLLGGATVGLVLGPFQVLAPIGKGGMGTVYLARDSRTQQLLALKVLPPKRAQEKDRLLTRFKREMEISLLVSHPHLTRTFEVGVHQGVYYIAMEFIPGRNLRRLVSDEGPLTVPRAARLFTEVALGLEHAHEQGLIHRDLKPSNIIITPHDRAKILDLGLALVQDEIPSDRAVVGGQGFVVGTMDYLAPEQAVDSSRVDVRSDIYSLGCTLYHALTGQPPFPGGNTMEKIHRHLNSEPTALAQLNPTVPVAFSQLVQRMMAKRPEKRPASAAALREQLQAWAPRVQKLFSDQKDESLRQQAAAALTAAEVAPDLVREPIIVVSPSESAKVGAPLVFQTLFRAAPFARTLWADHLVLLGIGALGLLGLATIFLMFLLAR